MNKDSVIQKFDVYAESYENLLNQNLRLSGEKAPYFAAYKAEYILRLIQDQSIERPGYILEIGCGIGLLVEALANTFGADTQILGYDPSVKCINVARKRLARPNVRFSINREDLPRGECDLVLISNVLHHIAPEQRMNFLRTLPHHMSRSGYLVVIEHNPWNPLTRWSVQHSPLDEDAALLSRPQARRIIETANFRCVRGDYLVFFPRWLSLLRPLEKRYLGCLPLGAQYALVGCP